MGEREKDKRKRGVLSKRQKSIIYMLIQMKAETLTVAAISEKLGVSSRTVLRELPAIEQWLLDNDFKFSRKPGKGLVINETEENLELIEELLHAENVIPLYSRKERCRQLLGELLFASEPIKTYVFTSRFNISERTLYGDLDALDTWFSEYQIRIVRRTGLGIFLDGDEVNIRQAIANAVFEFCDTDRIPSFIMEFQEKSSASALSKIPLLVFLEEDIVKFTQRVIDECEKMLRVNCIDSSRLRLTLRFASAIYRMKTGHFLEEGVLNHAKMMGLREYSAAEYIAEEIQKEYNLNITESEVDYLAMHFSTTRMWSDATEYKDPLQTLGVRQVVIAMTGIAGQMTGIPFQNDHVLIDDLEAHITGLKRRITMRVISEDTETETVRQNYPEIYDAVVTSVQVLKEWLAPDELRSADIGYIAMHFAAAAERIQKHEQQIVVAVVCPTGIASSKMLTVALMRTYPNIVIKKVLSAFSIDEEKLYQDGIDFIISTVELKINFPYICVEKMLQIQDRVRIQKMIEKISQDRLKKKIIYNENKEVVMTIDDVRKISAIGTEIIELINHFTIQSIPHMISRRELMEHAASIVTNSPEGKQKVMERFQRREELGDSYIEEMKICLFHCETDAVEHSRFAYLLLEHPIETSKGMAEGAVVMAVPKRKNEEYLKEPMGRLSALLVENTSFLQALKRSDSIAGLAYVETALVKYFQQNNLK